MRLLIISNTPWDNNNSFGSSYSNIFGGIEDCDIANIYCQNGLPNNDVVKRHFRITEKDILRNWINPKSRVGTEIEYNNRESTKKENSSNSVYRLIKRLRLRIFWMARDLIWSSGRWKSQELGKFVESFNPDLIFLPIYYSNYIGEIAIYIQERLKIPIVGYISDDCYTLKQFSLSPLFWIDRFWKRKYVKRAINRCELLYVITQRQKEEYEALFNPCCKILFKGGDFNEQAPSYKTGTPLRFVYTGNIGAGRWKTLAKIAKALKIINEDEIKAKLEIYTGTEISAKMNRKLNVTNSSQVMGFIPFDKVKDVQSQADVLVHVEPFSLSERYKARLSFSTKIVDYLKAGRCILAVGWEKTGGIEYLNDNDAAFIITNKRHILSRMKELICSKNLIERLSTEAYGLGCRNHDIGKIREGLITDLKKVVKNFKLGN